MKITQNPGVTEPLVTGSNDCTEPIRVRPIRSDVLILWRDEENEAHRIDKSLCKGSLVGIDGRQWWDVYYYAFGNGWNCERGNVCLRLDEKDFQRSFGYIPVIHKGELVNQDIWKEAQKSRKQRRRNRNDRP